MSKPDLSKFTIKVQGGREYLTAAGRIVWFRQEHPDWAIVTKPLSIDEETGYALFSACIKDAAGSIVATAHKTQTRKQFSDFVGKAETGAISRALSFCGFGTDDLDDDTEADRRPVDSPQQQQRTHQQTQAPQQPQRAAAQPAQAARAYQEQTAAPTDASKLRNLADNLYALINPAIREEWKQYIQQTYKADGIAHVSDADLPKLIKDLEDALAESKSSVDAPAQEESPFGSTLPDDVTPTKKQPAKPAMRN